MPMEEDKITTIKLHQSTKEKLAKIGLKSETYEDIILKLLGRYNAKRNS